MLNQYSLEWASAVCLNKNQPSSEQLMWPQSTRRSPLVINAGLGTTGTTFVDCVMGRLQYATKHGHKHDASIDVQCPGDDPWQCSRQHALTATQCVAATPCSTAGAVSGAVDMVRNGSSCTTSWDTYDYISDSPVPDQLAWLLDSHPGAFVLLTIRNPLEWLDHRLARLSSGPFFTAKTPLHFSGCQLNLPALYHSAAANGSVVNQRHVALYNAFAICLARRDHHPLLILNLFQDDVVNCQQRFHAFMRQVRPVNFTSMQQRWDQCQRLNVRVLPPTTK